MNEEDRLRVLASYEILDTKAEDLFDNLVELAARICRTPMCAMSLVDSDRQWFKASVGLNTRETPIEDALCRHAIKSDELLIIEDATKDERSMSSNLVSRDPKIRFYAGAPLITKQGAALGTLCVLDTKPGRLEDDQLKSLEILRDAIVAQLEYRKVLKDLQYIQKLIPICAWCHNIKKEAGDTEDWVPIEEFVADIAPLSHGICPTCSSQLESAE